MQDDLSRVAALVCELRRDRSIRNLCQLARVSQIPIARLRQLIDEGDALSCVARGSILTQCRLGPSQYRRLRDMAEQRHTSVATLIGHMVCAVLDITASPDDVAAEKPFSRAQEPPQ